MSDHQENKSQASPEAKKPPVEDLAPTEEQSADLRGGPIYGQRSGGSGGGAGHSSTGGSGAG